MKIRLNNNLCAIVDQDDLNRLGQYKWKYNGKYAVRSDKNSQNVYMHREIMCANSGVQVDHINGDKLDNRKCNLRFANNSQQRMNQGIQKNNSSGYRGVTWDKRTKSWKVRVQSYGKVKNLGRFKDKLAAHEAYERVSIEIFGEFKRGFRILEPA